MVIGNGEAGRRLAVRVRVAMAVGSFFVALLQEAFVALPPVTFAALLQLALVALLQRDGLGVSICAGP